MQDADVVGRRDLRRERAISVDPPGCQDIDDAMHVTRKPNGKLQVWYRQQISRDLNFFDARSENRLRGKHKRTVQA